MKGGQEKRTWKSKREILEDFRGFLSKRETEVKRRTCLPRRGRMENILLYNVLLYYQYFSIVSIIVLL